MPFIVSSANLNMTNGTTVDRGGSEHQTQRGITSIQTLLRSQVSQMQRNIQRLKEMQLKVLLFPIKIYLSEIFTRATPGSSLVIYKSESDGGQESMLNFLNFQLHLKKKMFLLRLHKKLKRVEYIYIYLDGNVVQV